MVRVMCKQCKIFTEKGKYYCPESMDHFVFCPFCGERLEFKEGKITYSNIKDYIKSLDAPETYEQWRYACDLWVKYGRLGIDPDEYMDEIIEKVEKYK